MALSLPVQNGLEGASVWGIEYLGRVGSGEHGLGDVWRHGVSARVTLEEGEEAWIKDGRVE